MTISHGFVRGNHRVNILPNRGEAYVIPVAWRPLLGDYDALVVILEMHMFVHGSSQDCFQYGAPTMRSFLSHLLEVQAAYRDRGLRLAVVQIGDLYELRLDESTWNTVIRPTAGVISAIRNIDRGSPLCSYTPLSAAGRRGSTGYGSGRTGCAGANTQRWRYHWANASGARRSTP